MKTQVSGKCHLWPNVGVGDAKTYLWRPDYHSTVLLLAQKAKFTTKNWGSTLKLPQQETWL